MQPAMKMIQRVEKKIPQRLIKFCSYLLIHPIKKRVLHGAYSISCFIELISAKKFICNIEDEKNHPWSFTFNVNFAAEKF